MFRLIFGLLSFSLVAWPAVGQGLRDGEAPLSAAELSSELSGKVVEFFDGSTATYQVDGGYAYHYQPSDPPFVGTYKTTEDRGVCVTFDNGFSRCDSYVRSGDRLVLIIEDGTRFPARHVTSIDVSN